MSIKAQTRACSYCGAVMEMRLLKRVDDKTQPGVDTYACPECIADHSVRTGEASE